MRKKTDGTYYTILDHVQQILIHEMDLDSQRVTIAGQKFTIPPDDGMIVIVEPKGAPKVLSNRNTQEPVTGGLTEIQNTACQEMVAVMLLSRTMEAYERAVEALQSISSLYSQRVQEANSFKIARLSSIENLSDLEGSGILYRYEISIVAFTWYEKTKSAEYFDDFGLEINTEKDKVEIALT